LIKIILNLKHKSLQSFNFALGEQFGWKKVLSMNDLNIATIKFTLTIAWIGGKTVNMNSFC